MDMTITSNTAINEIVDMTMVSDTAINEIL